MNDMPVQGMVSHGVAGNSGAPLGVAGPDRTTLRLNFSNATEGRIAEGIGRLGRAIAEALP